tara:strand:- start:993 stop:1538 length:546 start_codon:yes stop_codon:yes gene_type:complete
MRRYWNSKHFGCLTNRRVIITTLNSWKQFLASAPESQREIRTIEIDHVDLPAPQYFAQNYTDFIAEGVTYKAAGLVITEPAERNDSEQNLSISMGAVTDELQAIIDQITEQGFLSELKVTYRKYYSGDLSEPAITPTILYGSSITFENSDRVSFVAEDTDLTNKRAGKLYTLSLFPGISTE